MGPVSATATGLVVTGAPRSVVVSLSGGRKVHTCAAVHHSSRC
jgi:hypothetical protein